MISIIVPIYNVENFLEDCLLSIQNQTYKNFECIMVNDGATDSSPEIAQRFADSDVRFKLIHQDNAGLSAARNTGLKNANGDYVTFLDSDDLFHHHYLEVCLREVEDFDILEVSTVKFVSGEKVNVMDVNEYTTEKYIDVKETIEAIVEWKISTAAWGKFYSNKIKKDLKFPEGRIYEDLPVVLDLYKKGYCLKKISFAGHFYRKGHASILTNPMSERDWDLFYICEQIEKNFEGEIELLPSVYKILAGNVMYQFLYKTNFLTKDRSRHKKMIREYLKKSSSLNMKQRLMLINPDVVWLANYVRNKIRRKKYA